LAVLPAGEVSEPQRTLPLGLVLGMAIATIFYLLTAASVVIALPTEAAQASQRPLADALASLLPSLGLPAAIGGVVMSAGALVSIAGVYDVFTLSLARLSLQAPAPLLALGAFAMLVGLAAYLLRRTGWREGSKLLTRAEDDERRLARWAARRERWLVDWPMRGEARR